jgi:hypothetical protein
MSFAVGNPNVRIQENVSEIIIDPAMLYLGFTWFAILCLWHSFVNIHCCFLRIFSLPVSWTLTAISSFVQNTFLLMTLHSTGCRIFLNKTVFYYISRGIFPFWTLICSIIWIFLRIHNKVPGQSQQFNFISIWLKVVTSNLTSVIAVSRSSTIFNGLSLHPSFKRMHSKYRTTLFCSDM